MEQVPWSILLQKATEASQSEQPVTGAILSFTLP